MFVHYMLWALETKIRIIISKFHLHFTNKNVNNTSANTFLTYKIYQKHNPKISNNQMQ